MSKKDKKNSGEGSGAGVALLVAGAMAIGAGAMWLYNKHQKDGSEDAEEALKKSGTTKPVTQYANTYETPVGPSHQVKKEEDQDLKESVNPQDEPTQTISNNFIDNDNPYLVGQQKEEEKVPENNLYLTGVTGQQKKEKASEAIDNKQSELEKRALANYPKYCELTGTHTANLDGITIEKLKKQGIDLTFLAALSEEEPQPNGQPEEQEAVEVIQPKPLANQKEPMTT